MDEMHPLKKALVGALGALGILCGLLGLSSIWTLPTEAQVGPPNQILCNKGIINTANPVALTQIVAGVPGQAIAVCGWHATTTVTATNSTFQLEYGTGTNCGTNTTSLTPAINVASTAPSADHVDFAHLGLPAGASLCLITAGTTPNIELLVYVSQQ
jgi:hypothetical protein